MSTRDTTTRGLSPNDPNSFSNPENITTKSLHISWELDFPAQKLKGCIHYHLVRSNVSVSVVVFDTRNLHIKTIYDEDTHSKLSYSIEEQVLTFGQGLYITLPHEVSWTEKKIVIEYETTSESTALQWLSKEQTAGKGYPYVFTKCSAIHARSLLPCQDTPYVKCTYTAEVVGPSDLTVLMGAVKVDSTSQDPTATRHNFVQKIPIPSYLIAMVAGKLESRKIGPRTSVWAEPELIESAAFEFEDTDKMLIAEENLMGAYVWGVLDILVLPPSFPSGGMENPCLTFVTPTIIAGDKSLTNVIAHEIAHSWSGNLVTNKNFEHFWLNEGITVYIERRVLGILYEEPFRHFAAIGGLKALKATIQSMGREHPLTALVPNLALVDPMDAFTVVPYEKGFLFLFYLEQKVGGKESFEGFLKEFIWTNAYKSVDTACFRKMFIAHFTQRGNSNLIEDIDWDAWLYSPGMPSFEPQYDSSFSDVCTRLKTKWLDWDPGSTPCPFSAADLDKFSLRSEQTQEFLAQLREIETPLGIEKIRAMAVNYNFNATQNSEIKFLWIMICIKEKHEQIVPLALKFITEQGRLKFIRPIYRALHDWEHARPEAIATLVMNQSSMMRNSVNIIRKDLGLI